MQKRKSAFRRRAGTFADSPRTSTLRARSTKSQESRGDPVRSGAIRTLVDENLHESSPPIIPDAPCAASRRRASVSGGRGRVRSRLAANADPRAENPGRRGSDPVGFWASRGGEVPRSQGDCTEIWTQMFSVCRFTLVPRKKAVSSCPGCP